MRGHVVELPMLDGGARVLAVDAEGRWQTADAAHPLYDVGGGIALGGLVDGHAHMTSDTITDMTEADRRPDAPIRLVRNAAAQLTSGVLVVFDKGTHDPSTVDATLAIPVGERPDTVLAGRFLAGPNGYYPELAIEVQPGGLEASTAGYGPDAATWVKVIGDWPRREIGAVPSFGESELRAAVAVAHGAGRKVAIHTAAPETATLAVRAGVDSIEHGLFLTMDDIVRLGERRGAWVPTIRAMESLLAALRPGSTGASLLAEGLDNVRRLLPHAVEAGVVVMGGTDLVLAHGAVALEGAALAEYGMTEKDALEALTGAPRAFLDSPAFRVGEPADFIVVAAPTLAALRDPRLVVRWGRVVVDRRT